MTAEGWGPVPVARVGPVVGAEQPDGEYGRQRAGDPGPASAARELSAAGSLPSQWPLAIRSSRVCRAAICSPGLNVQWPALST
ncbi:hypothetical protein [Streptomyces sp. NPDC005760]|uniref:hypothetical protein n=1 Tax=Streptomyces sp. NPDC005760 TaxID=3156718 RepID=UPI0033F1C1C4